MSTTSNNIGREQFMAPGWYIDPADTQMQRRWDGYTWTADTVPAPQQAPSTKPDTAIAAAVRGLWERNHLALVALAVCALYLVVDSYTNFAVFGLIPISLSIQAFRRREPLAFAAAIGTVAAVAAPFVLFQH